MKRVRMKKKLKECPKKEKEKEATGETDTDEGCQSATEKETGQKKK